MHNIRFEVEHCTAEFTCARREADAGRTEREKKKRLKPPTSYG